MPGQPPQTNLISSVAKIRRNNEWKMTQNEQNNKTTQAHFVKALSILQQRLANSDNEISTSDSTILVVVGLTMIATFRGDYKTALKHLMGLQNMTMLRGGFAALEENKQLQTKIFRADLRVALGAGCKPIFFSDGYSWDHRAVSQEIKPILCAVEPYPNVRLPSSELRHFLESLDIQLRLLWNTLSEYVQSTNTTTEFDVEPHQTTFVSIHYHLLNLNFEASNVNETMRYALLAFASSAFLAWRGIKNRYEYLAQSFRSAITMLTIALPAQLSLWLYVMGAICVFNESERAWLQPALIEILESMRLTSWSEVRFFLKTVLWVDALHDAPAKQVIEAALHQ